MSHRIIYGLFMLKPSACAYEYHNYYYTKILWLTIIYTPNYGPHGTVIIQESMELMSVLLPPGIRNEGNICFASSILQCLLNQTLFKKVLADIGVSHVPACDVCEQGCWLNYVYICTLLL